MNQEDRPHMAAVIMAAGLGKRMRSKTAKVMHPVAGRPMIWYMASIVRRLVDSHVVLVLGHGAEQVQAYVRDQQARLQPVDVVIQEQQLGTGDAVKQARCVLMNGDRPVAKSCVIVNGDTPLLTADTLQHLLQAHQSEQSTVTLLTTELLDPHGYGRVVRGADQHVVNIVEDRDASPAELGIQEINVGTYVVDTSFLFRALEAIEPHNAQGEYYLTDIVGLAVAEGLKVAAVKTGDASECWGINTREHLAMAEQVMRKRICGKWLREGVTMMDPSTTMIDDEVTIGQDTVLFPQVTIEGSTTVGQNCVIRSHTRVTNSHLADEVVIEDCCVLEGAVIEGGASIGPFARLRPGTIVRAGAKIGNFVEVKNTEVGAGSKANHLTYLGDCRVGEHVNIGAGTITCNYDGFRKATTIIEDDVFIGSDSQLIAPVTIGKGAVVGAGSTVTEDVPADAIAIARSKQSHRLNAAARRRAARAKKNSEK